MTTVDEVSTKTAKCPDCGKKYLVATGYCLSCKKKVAKKKESEMEVITIEKDIRIPGTNIILEKGDRIQIFSD